MTENSLYDRNVALSQKPRGKRMPQVMDAIRFADGFHGGFPDDPLQLAIGNLWRFFAGEQKRRRFNRFALFPFPLQECLQLGAQLWVEWD